MIIGIHHSSSILRLPPAVSCDTFEAYHSDHSTTNSMYRDHNYTYLELARESVAPLALGMSKPRGQRAPARGRPGQGGLARERETQL